MEVTFGGADLPFPQGQFGFRMTWKSDREASGSSEKHPFRQEGGILSFIGHIFKKVEPGHLL